ncbi:MAG: hypothetical protein QNJ16_13605 [Rhodobacter sp.]|nr:hypothetical protein [Rhodobacter sp.]
MIRKLWRSATAIAASAMITAGAHAGGHEQPAPDFANMQARMEQLVRILTEGESCEGVGAAIDLTLGLVYGGTRPLPSLVPKDLGEAQERFGRNIDQDDIDIAGRAETAQKDIAETVRRVIEALERLALGEGCPALGGRAADVKFFLEEMEDVAAALSGTTRQCTVGSSLVDGPCAQLRQQLNEETGHLFKPGEAPEELFQGYEVKLRSPFIPRYNRLWEEDVKLIPALQPGECGSVFKETKGLMLRLRLDGFTTVLDPWATPNLPRGTKIPIWTLTWVPSEYVKHFNVCNNDGKIVHTTVHQRVKQDVPLNFFWRYYPKTPH